MEPLDSLAFVGPNPSNNKNKNSNVYIVIGDSGNGITHGTIAGILLSDLILSRKNEWLKVYDPSRQIGNREKGENKDGNHNTKDDKSKKDENSNSIEINKTQTLVNKRTFS